MSKCYVELTELAKEDFEKLPRDIQKECFTMLKKLEKKSAFRFEIAE